MKARVLFLPLALAPLLALADGSGTLYREGKPTKLLAAYAYRGPDPFDEKKEITTVVLADRAIDRASVDAASDRGEALDDQLRKAGAVRVELNIEADGSVENVNFADGGSSGSMSGSGWYTLKLARSDARRIEGTFRTNDEAAKKDGRYFDLAFALDLPGAADLGTALPSDGGEPGKAWRAYAAALDSGDVDALAKTMTKSRADELSAHRNDADFKMMFAFIRSSALRHPKITAGHASGDRATLELSGSDGDGHPATSTVTLLRDGGAWRVEKESMKSHAS